MKVLATVGILACVAFLSQASPHCHLSELCDCLDIYIAWVHSLPKRTIPVTEDDVQVLCNTLDKSVGCALGYRDNCTTPLQKEVIGLVVEGALDLHKDFCTPGSEIRSNFLAHSPCLNKLAQSDENKELVEYFLAVFEKCQTIPMNKRVTFGCCAHAKIRNAYRKLNKDTCGQEAVDFVGGLIERIIAQLPDVLCHGFVGDEDHCKELLPPDGAKPSGEGNKMALYKYVNDWFTGWLE